MGAFVCDQNGVANPAQCPSIERCEGAGDPLSQQLIGAWEHWELIEPQFDGDVITGIDHFLEMSEETKAGDIRAGMNAIGVLMFCDLQQLFQSRVLAFGHLHKGGLERCFVADCLHGGGEDDACS